MNHMQSISLNQYAVLFLHSHATLCIFLIGRVLVATTLLSQFSAQFASSTACRVPTSKKIICRVAHVAADAAA